MIGILRPLLTRRSVASVEGFAAGFRSRRNSRKTDPLSRLAEPPANDRGERPEAKALNSMVLRLAATSSRLSSHDVRDARNGRRTPGGGEGFQGRTGGSGGTSLEFIGMFLFGWILYIYIFINTSKKIGLLDCVNS